ncbi:MAG: hypothetical protein JEZ03_18030 [Bacteroidales bacterium]|nr:hypothetical protein [Bacteroidales bacterium]
MEIIPLILYVLIYLVLGVILSVPFVYTSNSIVAKKTKKSVTDYKQVWFIKFPILLIFAFILFVAPYFALTSLGYKPPLKKINIEISTDGKKSDIDDLTSEIDNISGVLSNINNLTINEIQNELIRTKDFVSRLKQEAINQHQILENLRIQTQKSKEEAEAASKMNESIKALTKDELDAIQFLITKNANDSSVKSFWLGVLISFPIGVLASIFATFIWNFINRKKTIN